MLKKILGLVMLATCSGSAVESTVGMFFSVGSENLIRVSMEEYKRKVCGTNGEKVTVNYSDATYRPVFAADPNSEKKAPIVTLFLFDRVNIYGDDFVYAPIFNEVTGVDEVCYTGELLTNMEKVLTFDADSSEKCYTNWKTEVVNGKSVICGEAVVAKKVLIIPKTRAEQEKLVKQYLPNAVNSQGVIDEQLAYEEAVKLNPNVMIGNSSANKTDISF